MKTTDKTMPIKEALVSVLAMGLFFTVNAVTGIYYFVKDWWQEFRPEEPGDNY